MPKPGYKPALLLAVLIRKGDQPGLTRGEIRTAAGLPPDTEITRPLRELRQPWNGKIDVRCTAYKIDGKWVHRYWLPQRVLKKLRAAKAEGATRRAAA